MLNKDLVLATHPPHFTEVGAVTCPRSHNQLVAEPGCESRAIYLFPKLSTFIFPIK